MRKKEERPLRDSKRSRTIHSDYSATRYLRELNLDLASVISVNSDSLWLRREPLLAWGADQYLSGFFCRRCRWTSIFRRFRTLGADRNPSGSDNFRMRHVRSSELSDPPRVSAALRSR
jgi:hypothetical protein